MLYNDIVSSYGDFGHEKISKNAGWENTRFYNG